MSSLLSLLLAVGSSLVLVFGLYFPRHRRVDLVVGMLVLTVGVAVITLALSRSTSLGAGFGLGLMGVLSIIRFRSTELSHQDVSYAFASLSLGLIGGISIRPAWAAPALCVVVLAALFVGDHPRLFRSYRQQTIVLDRAIPNETDLLQHLEELLGAKVHRMTVRELDLVEQTTLVDVRFVQLLHAAQVARS